VFAKGGRVDTGLDAVEWVKFGEQSGAGEVVVNSIDTDGVRGGFDLEMLKAIGDAVRLPLIASGGAGKAEDFIELFRLPRVDAGLAASIFHSRETDIRQLKRMLKANGIPMRV
ncbi:MAG: HisA/HisF-related TIM barrel protein, partial [Bacillota bacterium]